MKAAIRREATIAARFSRRLQQAWLGRGPLALACLPLALLFAAVVRARQLGYRLGWREVRTLPAPVVVVGNLIAGGAGKTPTVIAVIGLLRRHGFTPGIISRGYGRRGDAVLAVQTDTAVGEAGDEPLLLRRATGAPVFVGRDRVGAAEALLARHPDVDIIVSDDGLQHSRLARAAQVLVFDERGAGNGWPLPAGPMREPMPATIPDRTVVLYNASRPSTHLAGTLVQRSLRPPVSLATWRAGQAATAGFAALQGRRLIAAAGLARPERFFAMLSEHGLSFTPMPLPDHFDFAALPWPANTTDVLVTEKDAVKLDPTRLGPTNVWVVALDFVPDPAFGAALLALLPAPRSLARAMQPVPLHPLPLRRLVSIPPGTADDGNPTP